MDQPRPYYLSLMQHGSRFRGGTTRYPRYVAQWDSLDVNTREAFIHQVYTSTTDLIEIKILRKAERVGNWRT